MTTFSLWLKNELSSQVAKVSISKRLRDQPAVLFGQVSASMRMMMSMMEQSGQGGQMDQMNKNQTLEINPNHPIIVKLNQLRKKDAKKAGLLARQLMDNILLNAGIPNLDVMNDYLLTVTSKSQISEGVDRTK